MCVCIDLCMFVRVYSLEFIAYFVFISCDYASVYMGRPWVCVCVDVCICLCLRALVCLYTLRVDIVFMF